MDEKVAFVHQKTKERCSEDDLKGMMLLPFSHKKNNNKKKKNSKNILTSVTFTVCSKVDSDTKS